jgi:hypothetical protein
MEYNRDIKDYYCEHCKKSLKSLKLTDKLKGGGAGGEQPDDDSEDSSVPAPEMSTVKGLLYMIFGNILIIIAPLLIFVCQFIELMGFIILILGFFMIYQDRNNFSKKHNSNIKFASVLMVVWIIINIIILIYSYNLILNLQTDLNPYKDNQTIPNSIIINYYNDLKLIYLGSVMVVSLSAILRFLTIKELIQDKLKKYLPLVVILLIIAGFLNMFIFTNLADRTAVNLEENTKSDLITGPLNTTTDVDPGIIEYSVIMLGGVVETIMLLLFYFTYTHQRSKQSEIIDI